MAERKGKKLRRCNPKNKAYYKVQMGKTDANKKKHLSKHIRSNPNDVVAITRYERDMGKAVGLLATLTPRGRKLLERSARVTRAL
jgi:hypothetical protein